MFKVAYNGTYMFSVAVSVFSPDCELEIKPKPFKRRDMIFRKIISQQTFPLKWVSMKKEKLFSGEKAKTSLKCKNKMCVEKKSKLVDQTPESRPN